ERGDADASEIASLYALEENVLPLAPFDVRVGGDPAHPARAADEDVSEGDLSLEARPRLERRQADDDGGGERHGKSFPSSQERRRPSRGRDEAEWDDGESVPDADVDVRECGHRKVGEREEGREKGARAGEA